MITVDSNSDASRDTLLAAMDHLNTTAIAIGRQLFFLDLRNSSNTIGQYIYTSAYIVLSIEYMYLLVLTIIGTFAWRPTM